MNRREVISRMGAVLAASGVEARCDVVESKPRPILAVIHCELPLTPEAASHWRAKYNEVQAETWRDVERERMYQHMSRRAVSLAAKVTNLRRCLRDYMAGQRVAVAEARAELMAARGK